MDLVKIAIIVNPLIPVPPQQYGGIERIVFMLIQELIKNGHEVTLYANEHSHSNCKLVGYRETENYSINDRVRVNLLTSKIAFQHFDLVHTFGRMSNIALLMFSRLPKVVSYQLQPTVSQVKKAVKIAPNRSLYFVACSDHINRQIAAYADVTTIYNGVNVSNYKANINITEDAPLVFLGRIQKEKGTAVAIEIARKAGRKLVIAGNIPYEPMHQQYFDDMVKPWIDNEQISYIGPVNDSQKSELLRNSAALLMPVLWDEPFGIVMVEALACGTPVIGFNRGAVPEVIINGINGFVCSDTDEMIEAVDHLKDIDRQHCRDIAEQKFSSTILVKQYEALYQRIITSN